MLRTLIALAFVALTGSAPAQAKKAEVLWLGQAAFRITTPGGKVIVIDPWLKTNPKTPEGFKNLAGLGKVDLVLVTHGHPDHVTDAPELVNMHKVRRYAPPGVKDTLVTLGLIPADLGPGMNISGIVTPLGPEIKFNMVQANHSSGAGPSLIAFSAKAEAGIGEAMQRAFEQAGLTARIFNLGVSSRGAEIQI